MIAQHLVWSTDGTLFFPTVCLKARKIWPETLFFATHILFKVFLKKKKISQAIHFPCRKLDIRYRQKETFKATYDANIHC